MRLLPGVLDRAPQVRGLRGQGFTDLTLGPLGRDSEPPEWEVCRES